MVGMRPSLVAIIAKLVEASPIAAETRPHEIGKSVHCLAPPTHTSISQAHDAARQTRARPTRRGHFCHALLFDDGPHLRHPPPTPPGGPTDPMGGFATPLAGSTDRKGGFADPTGSSPHPMGGSAVPTGGSADLLLQCVVGEKRHRRASSGDPNATRAVTSGHALGHPEAAGQEANDACAFQHMSALPSIAPRKWEARDQCPPVARAKPSAAGW